MTLTETAIFTKKALVFIVLFLFLIFASWGGYSYWYNFIYLPGIPPEIELPNNKFGILPKPNLPVSKVPSETLNYTLDTETGKLPAAPNLYKVYSIAQLATDLLALDRAKDLAVSLGFSKEPEMLTATEYRFLSEKGGALTINLDTGNFRFQRPIATESASLIQNRESFQNPNTVSLQFKNYLIQKNLLKDQLKDGKTKVEYNTSQDKNVAEISLWEQDIDKTPIVTDTFNNGLIRSTVVNSGEEVRKYAALEYTYWPIDLNNFATYPIKNPDQAFKELQSGEGIVIVASKTRNVSITKVYLAYLLTQDYVPYLQPVYVFEGPDFTAYIPAITSDLLEK